MIAEQDCCDCFIEDKLCPKKTLTWNACCRHAPIATGHITITVFLLTPLLVLLPLPVVTATINFFDAFIVLAPCPQDEDKK